MYIYADNAATTSLSPAAREAMDKAGAEAWGNPSSPHGPGRAAMETLVRARETVAALLGAEPRQVCFTSGGTEADNQAILAGAAVGERQGKRHILLPAFEHPAVRKTAESLAARGFEVRELPVSRDGVVKASDIAAALREDTALVSVMTVNNEIGTLQPVGAIAALCRERGVLFHTDAVQAVGHVPVDFHALGADMLSLSAHKFHGPKGVGALLIRRGTGRESFLLGGPQERGLRAGTENVPGIAGMAAALAEACGELSETTVRVTCLRELLIGELMTIPGCVLNGDRDKRLPGTVHVTIPGAEGENMVLLLDGMGVAASAGSACASGGTEPGPTLSAMGVPEKLARCSLRLSLGRDNTEAEVKYIAAAVKRAAEKLRG